jgi:hypothetical protein
VTYSPAAADHLAEIDRRFEDHLAALRARADEAKAQVEHGVTAIAEAAGPAAPPSVADAYDVPDWGTETAIEEPPPYVAPPPNPYAEHALIPDSPIVTSEVPSLDDISLTDEDGIPLWQD